MTGLVACIVEGDGEVEAVPLLVQRIAIEARPDIIVNIARPPIRVPRNKRVKAGELERAVELAARRVGRGGATLVLTGLFDFQAARASDSFDKCYREIVKLIGRLREHAAEAEAEPPNAS